MEWYQYISAFFAGAFFANVIPHFVQGISGNKFPTPFAKPPGKGLSSPVVNVVWALFNLLVGYVLFRASKMNSSNTLSIVIFFSRHFSHRHHRQYYFSEKRYRKSGKKITIV